MLQKYIYTQYLSIPSVFCFLSFVLLPFSEKSIMQYTSFLYSYVTIVSEWCRLIKRSILHRVQPISNDREITSKCKNSKILVQILFACCVSSAFDLSIFTILNQHRCRELLSKSSSLKKINVVYLLVILNRDYDDDPDKIRNKNIND